MKIQPFFTALLFIFLTGTIIHAAPKQEAITMTIPASVVSDAVSKSLPFTFPIHSSTLLGTVSIDTIENLQFRPDTLSAHVSISGHDMKIVTSIAGHDLRMKIGTLIMSFQCDASIRFDPTSQTLFLRPVISDLQSKGDKKADAASAIILLFNNQEFAIQIDKLSPIVKDSGSKLLSISMNTADIKVGQDSLLLSILPAITVTQKQKK